MDTEDWGVAVGRVVAGKEPAIYQHASPNWCTKVECLPVVLPELEVVAPLLMDAGPMLAPTNVADTASAEETAATRPRPLLAVLQQLLLVPFTEQQKSPFLTAEPWHSTTQLASPDTNINLTRDISAAECLPEVQNVGQVAALYVLSVQPPL